MTPDGVTHVRPLMPSKFTALADWMGESSLFNALSTQPFMKLFYLAKAHDKFSSLLRNALYQRSRQCVVTRSLHACVCFGSDSFAAVLRRIAGVCHQVQCVQLFDCRDVRHTRSAVEFADFKNSQCVTRACYHRAKL